MKGKFLLVESEILGFGSGIQVPLTKTGIQNLKSGTHGVESRILDSPHSLTWGDTLKIRKILVVISAPSRLVFPGKEYFQRKHPNISNNKDPE